MLKKVDIDARAFTGTGFCLLSHELSAFLAYNSAFSGGRFTALGIREERTASFPVDVRQTLDGSKD